MATIAMPVDDDFEDSELRIPYDELWKAGHEVILLGTERGKVVRGKRGRESVTIDATPQERSVEELDAVVIPGGYSPDRLRMHEPTVGFVRRFASTGKPVAAICHAAQLLIEAEVVRGRTMTSWPSVRTDLVNAGARWVDREVVEDENFITSRNPDDLPAFSRAILARL